MPLGLFLVTASVALLWSGLKNKDLREAIPLFLQNKDPDDAKAISAPLPSDEPQAFGFSDTTTSKNLGGTVKWTKARVFVYGLNLTRAFGPKIISHCRPGARTTSGNVSLHASCLALDMRSNVKQEEKLARWAIAQGVFREVIYTKALTQGSVSDGVIAMHDGRVGTRHVHIGFHTSSKQPIIPGSQSGGGSGGGSF